MISSQRLLRRLASNASIKSSPTSSSSSSKFRCLHSQAASRQPAITSCTTTTQPRPSLLCSQSIRPSVYSTRHNNNSNKNNRRHLHYIPTLPNQNEYYNNGIGQLFSAPAFDIAWEKWQNHMINNLNRLVGGTEHEDKTPLEIAIMTSRSSEHAAIFNYASSAHNNHFFFEGLTAIDPPPVIPESLKSKIVGQFGTMEAFRNTLLTTAEMVFGNAFVWVVMVNNKDIKILVTYNAGTPYSNIRRQPFDIGTTTPGTEDYTGIGTSRGGIPQARLGERRNISDSNLDIIDPTNKFGGGGLFSGGFDEEPRKPLVPLMCVNVWQHAYMFDHGIEGKRNYLEAWFEAINWQAVIDRMPATYHGVTSRRNLGI